MRIPEYDYDTFPYVIARTKNNLSLINVRTRSCYVLTSE
jgi:hypothetical protein